MGAHLCLASMLLAILSVSTVSCTVDSVEDDGIFRIPLVRMKSGLETLMEKGADLKLIDGLYKMARRPMKYAGSADTLPLFKYFDTEYYGIVNIGKPGRAFKMVFDTVWSHSWVPSVDCPKIRIPCARHNRYNHRTSSTYKADGTKFNMSGEIIGYMSKDVFLVGQMNSTDQSFAEISRLPWIFSLLESDGIVGLGFQSGSPGFTPFFYNFFVQNHLPQAIFSFYMNRDPTTKNGGTILFGGIDPKHHKGEFSTIDVISGDFWTFKMTKVTLIISTKSTVEFCKNGCTATADTSSNTIVGPPEDIQEINQLIGAENIFFDRALIPCIMEYKGPKVNFTIGNKNYQVLGRDYVQKLSYSGITVCLSAFQPMDKDASSLSDWRLGGAFLYQYYSAFDIKNRKIMLADAA